MDRKAASYGTAFICLGIFAIIGGLYSWGSGPITNQQELIEVLIPWGDILVTGPLSLICAYGIIKSTHWGYVLGVMVCGIYIFGSALVYISLVWQGAPYPPQVAIPPLGGILFSVSYTIWFSSRSLVREDLPARTSWAARKINPQPKTILSKNLAS